MAVKRYALIKGEHVVNVLAFDDPTKELLDLFIQEHNVDDIIEASIFASPGGTYDGLMFWPPKPYSSWVKNYESNEWEPPIPYPNDDKNYIWNEDMLDWEEITE